MILESRLSVIDGVRFPDDRAFLIEAFGPSFKLHYVEAAAQIREQRMLALRGENMSFRHAAKSKTEREISGLKNFATSVLENNSTLEALYNQVDTIF